MSDAKRLYQKVGQELRVMLSSGKFEIGSRLPPEREIAAQFEVSRAVIREALIMLELESLIDVRKGSGVYVINLPDNVKPAQSAADDVGPFEMLQARQLLESNIAAFAATQLVKSDIADLRNALEQERLALESGQTNYDGDELFHTLIAKATQNSLLEDMVHDLWMRRNNSAMWQKLHTHISNQDYRRNWLSDHQKILQALQCRDPQGARQAMWQHLENVKQTLMVLSDSDDPGFDGYLFDSVPVEGKGA
ncbi:MAG: FCD domain-containing protein [Budvicia sp.]|nr:FCD domain-containing protein [Budvicia sp.]